MKYITPVLCAVIACGSIRSIAIGQTWFEFGDAGRDSVMQAQVTRGQGAMTQIAGVLGSLTDGDLYEIRITDPTTFRAQVTTAGFNSVLALFNADGTLQVYNDNFEGNRAAITNQGVFSAGVYYLAICQRRAIPMGDLGELPSDEVWPGPDQDQFRPASSEVLTRWNLSGTVVQGSYSVSLSGAAFSIQEPIVSNGFIPIGANPALGLSSTAYAVSADGETVVGQASPGGMQRAFIWNRVSGLRTNSLFPARGLSADGRTVVGGSGSSVYAWTEEGGTVGFEAEPGIPNRPLNAFGVSGNGLVIAGQGGNPINAQFISLVTNTIHPLGALPGGGASAAYAASFDGSVVVGASDSFLTGTRSQAFRWTAATGLQALGTLGGTPLESYGYGVTADGASVFGTSRGPSGLMDGFRWTSTTGIQSLGAQASGLQNTFVYGCSSDGRFAFGGTMVNGGQFAVIWSEQTGWRMLSALADEAGINRQGYDLRLVRAVSANGRTFVGQLIVSNIPKAFVLTLPPMGICCGVDGSCTISFQSSCDAGGSWGEDSRACAPELCSFAVGACCSGTECVTQPAIGCAGSFVGLGTVCGNPGNPTSCCPANFNHEGGLGVQDIFDFLAAYFSGDMSADFNAVDGLGVQDIFDFLSAYFAGCA